MEEIKSPFKSQLFICCRLKENKPCCAAKGSDAWVDHLKDWTKKEGLNEKVRVSKSSCLHQCEHGVAAVFYPQDRWMRNLTEADIPLLKEILKEYSE